MIARCGCGKTFDVVRGSGEELIDWLRMHVDSPQGPYCGKVVLSPNPWGHVVPGKEEAQSYRLEVLENLKE